MEVVACAVGLQILVAETTLDEGKRERVEVRPGAEAGVRKTVGLSAVLRSPLGKVFICIIKQRLTSQRPDSSVVEYMLWVSQTSVCGLGFNVSFRLIIYMVELQYKNILLTLTSPNSAQILFVFLAAEYLYARYHLPSITDTLPAWKSPEKRCIRLL